MTTNNDDITIDEYNVEDFNKVVESIVGHDRFNINSNINTENFGHQESNAIESLIKSGNLKYITTDELLDKIRNLAAIGINNLTSEQNRIRQNIAIEIKNRATTDKW